MNLYDAAWQLSDLLEANRTVFFKTEPEVPDFTCHAPFKVIVWGQKTQVELDVDQHNIMSVVGLFDATIFDKEKVSRLYTWNIKSFCSYFHFYTEKYITPTTSIIDLKVIESFLNIRKNRPENLVEAINRTNLTVKHKGWLPVYKSIHQPLFLRVLPTIESTPLLNEVSKRPEYPYYEIEGQVNGRMNCFKKYAKSYTPHNMGPDVRKALKPRGYNLRFMYADFRHCEVTVLQWLSGDARLKEIIDSGEDLHAKIYELITGDQCNTDSKRKTSKLMFLPVMYGCGPKGLADNIGVSEPLAAELIRRIKVVFPTACEWMRSKQEMAKLGPVTDHFGRIRIFEPDKAYLARDFSVQGVAATACLERLIALHKELNRDNAYVAYSVHDGFGMGVKIAEARNTYKLVKQVLEDESKLCPGLKMKVEIKFGARLDNMKTLWRD